MPGEAMAPAAPEVATAETLTIGQAGASVADASGDAAAPLSRGTLIGRYVLLGRIGGGAMGEVYAAYDPDLDRRLAIKLLKHPGRGSLDASRGRLQREAQAMARLRHPNVLAVHDVGIHAEQVFVAMELVEGQTLKTWCQERPRTWREVRDVFLAAGRGLEAAHAAGLVHRDFKPDNVLIGNDGRVCVGDFGLARAAADEAEPGVRQSGLEETAVTPSSDALAVALTQTGTFLGTPAYMAPEQLTRCATDARADQFSFCVALHEALYGMRPFGGNTIGEITFEVLQGKLPDPPRGRAVPPWLRAAMARGLEARADGRFPSMAELLRAIERNPARRRRLIALGALLVAGAVAAALVVARRPAPQVLALSPQNLDLEEGPRGGVPTGWFAPQFSTSHGYRVEIVEAGARSGRRCAQLSRPGEKADERAFGNLMQTVRADAFRGKRLRMSAAARAEGGPAALWLRVDRKGGAMGFFDNMDERPIRAADWQRYEIVGQIEPDAETLNFGFILTQGGKAWLDDVRFEVVGEDVAQTGTMTRAPALAPQNLGFEEGPAGRPKGWTLACLSATDCDAATTTDRPGQGARSAILRRALGKDDPLSEVQLGQEVVATPYRGWRIRLSAVLRASGGGSARLWLQVGRRRMGFSFYDDLSYAPVRTDAWTPARLEALVPQDAQSISFGAILEGGGEAGFDAFVLETLPR